MLCDMKTSDNIQTLIIKLFEVLDRIFLFSAKASFLTGL